MNNNFCILPWLHLHSYPDGTVTPCCQWDQKQIVGDLKIQKLSEIAISDRLNQIRSDMLHNKSVSGCNNCHQTEKAGDVTSRIRYNERFQDEIPDYIEKTNTDGTINYDFKLKIINIRYSNLCNFACRTCGPTHSSLWAQELEDKKPVKNIIDILPNYLTEIYEQLPYAKKINFAGGESLLIEEHWQILDRLIKEKNTDVNIQWVTNLSKLTYKKKNLLDYVKHFKNLIIMVSIDASHERAELYRHGTVWDHIEKHLRELNEAGANLFINCTVGAMNVWHIPDLHRYLIETKLISSITRFQLSILVGSKWLSIKILPREYKQKVESKILDHINWLKINNINIDGWTEVINFMNMEDHTDLLPKFVEYNKELDMKRNQNSVLVFPELKNILSD